MTVQPAVPQASASHLAANKTVGLALDWRQANDEAARQAVLAAAERRKEAFLALMRDNPAAALEQAILIRDYVALPAELKPYFERPLSGRGDIDLVWEIHERGSRHCRHENIVAMGGETLRTFGADRHILPVVKGASLSGIRLGDQAVIRSSAVQRLPAEDLAAAQTLFPLAAHDGRDPVTQGPASDTHAAVINGKIHRFESEASLAHVETTTARDRDEAAEQRLAAVQESFEWLSAGDGGDLGGVGETPYMTNQTKVLFIRVDFSDFPGEPVTKAALQTTLASVNTQIDTFSYHNAGIACTVSDNVYRMPSTGASYATSGANDAIQTDARNLASAHYTIANYDVIGVFFPSLSGVPGSKITYGGLASIGGASHWINGSNNVNTITHEFGHNYGLYHANYWHPETQLGGSYYLPGVLAYGDIYDVMGSGSAPEGHFNHLAKNQLDWMPDSKVAEATGNGTFTIHRFDHPDALSNQTLAVRVPMSGNVAYWIGCRQLYTSTAYNLKDAAYVVAENLAQYRETCLIDMTPESQVSETDDRKDAGLPVGGTYYDSNAGVRFNTLAKGGTSPNEWIQVQVLFDPRIRVAATAVSIEEQSGTAHVVVQRAYSSQGAVSVNYATSNGTATVNSDYYAVSGTLTWADGDNSDRTIVIPIRPDAIGEDSETFTLSLSGAVGGVIEAAASSTTVTIVDAGQRLAGFNLGFFVNSSVRAIAPLANGKLIIGGNIGNITEGTVVVPISNIARLNADGSVDTGFLTGTGFNGQVNALRVQNDGKILVGGAFTSYNGTPCNRIARLHDNGQIDSSFVTAMGSGADGEVLAIEIEAGNNILAGGSFDTYNSAASYAIVRLTPTGSRDNSGPITPPFGSPAQSTVRSIVVEPDGKVTIGGSFYFGWTGSGWRSGIARLHSNGTRDTSFDPDAGAHADGSAATRMNVYKVIRLNDGRYLVGGWFTAYDEHPVGNCVRINPNGGYDGTFVAPSFDYTVHDALVQSSGRIVVGGWFDSPVSYLERLLTNGSADPEFNQGTGPGGWVYALAQSADGDLWVGGNFFSFNGSPTRPIVKIASGERPYDLWARANFSAARILAGDADPAADPDNDGMINLAEMAMGANPNIPNSDPVFGVSGQGGVTTVQSGGQSFLQLTLDKTALVNGAWFLAQFGSNLTSWSPANPAPGSNDAYDVIEDSATRFIVRDKTPLSPPAKRFGRIGIGLPN